MGSYRHNSNLWRCNVLMRIPRYHSSDQTDKLNCVMCCIGPCPPFFLGDILTIYHASTSANLPKMLLDGQVIAE